MKDLTMGDERDAVLAAVESFASLRPRIMEFAERVDGGGGNPVLTGCGSSLDAAAMACAGGRGEAVPGGDLRSARRADGRALVAVSRGGASRELLRASSAGGFAFAVTCEPGSPLAREAAAVLDLSPAQDSGFVAALSTLITAAALSVVVAPPEQRERRSDRLADALAGLGSTSPIPAGEIVWLARWSLWPLGRELVRKSIETGRRAAYGHPYEFLHGDEAAVSSSAAWVLIDEPEDARRFLELSRLDDERPGLVRLPLGDAADPVEIVRVLGEAYCALFRTVREGARP